MASEGWNVSSALILGRGEPSAAPGLLGVGQRLAGRFEVRALLGRGGMGAVYRAHDHQLEREVAVKIALQRAEGPRLERFRREGQLAAALNHPGIVRVHETGDLDGAPFLVCELVEGCRTLDVALLELDPIARVTPLIALARAVGHAHAQGVVHRDIKPGNVLVGADGRPRLADFGLATALDMSRLTRSGALVGTPTHMSPEQMRAERDAVGPHSDVWSLGVILYWALTGESPFQAETMVARMVEVLEGAITPPRRLAPAVTPALEAVCLHALQPDPRRRIPDGDALADALEAALTGDYAPPRRGGWILAVAVAIALGAGLAVWAAQASPAPGPVGGAPAAPAEAPSDPHVAGLALDALLAAAEPSALRLDAWVAEHADHPRVAEARRGAERAWLRAQRAPVFRVAIPDLEFKAPNVAFTAGRAPQLLVRVGDDDGREQFRRWRWAEGEASPLPPWPAERARLQSWALRGHTLVALRDGVASLVDLGRAPVEVTPLPGLAQAYAVALAPGAVQVALAAPGTIRLVSPREPGVVVDLVADPPEVRGLAFSPDGARLAALCAEPRRRPRRTRLQVWDLRDPAHPIASDWIPRGEQLSAHARGWVVSDGRQELRLLRLEDARELAWLPVELAAGGFGGAAHVAWADREGAGYLLSRQCVVELDMQAFQALDPRFPLEAPAGYRDFAFDPAGNHVALTVGDTATEQGRLEVWLLPRD